MAGWRRTADAATEPLTTTQAKSHLRVDGSDEDALIGNLVTAARQYVEEHTGRALITQTWEYTADAFPTKAGAIWLPRPPLIAVSQVQYVDTAGATQTWDSDEYRVDAVSVPGRVTLADGAVWPTPNDVSNAVTVTYTAGYGAASDVPEPIKQALLLLIGSWYGSRENEVVGTVVGRFEFAVKALLAPYRVYGLG